MEHIIEVTNLKKYFKDIKAVDDISFQVEKGQLYGFLGVNGAGKSTTINMLCTLLSKTEGEVSICGYQLGKDNEKIRGRIGVVFQDNSLDNRLTVKENLMIRASLYFTDSIVIKKNLENVCDILGIGELLDRQFRKLSGGQKRRCEIAKALMNTPEILFLDEPTTGLDPQTRQNVWDSIEALRREKDMTVFLTTHYMEEAAKAQYIGIMEAGKLVAQGTSHALKEKYANDLLRIYPKDKENIIYYLTEKGFIYEERSNHIRVNLTDTLSGADILSNIREYLGACELIQGTMDDVFLNVTGKNL
ncbi:MAG: ABC transporter ATP-binding protein [Anaerocolumna sp.]